VALLRWSPGSPKISLGNFFGGHLQELQKMALRKTLAPHPLEGRMVAHGLRPPKVLVGIHLA
jgi:hypothetical protein